MTLFATRFVERQPLELLKLRPVGEHGGYVVQALDYDLARRTWTLAHELDCANLESARSCVSAAYWRVPGPPGEPRTEVYAWAPEAPEGVS